MTDQLGGAVCDGLRVLEVASDPAGEMLGKILAVYGADVVKLEPPAGSPTRRIGPFAAGAESPDTSLTYWFYNTNKRSVVVDLPDELPALEPHLANADVLILSAPPSEIRRLGLDPADLAAKFPELVICVMTPFGVDGPWADYLTSDLVALAAGGILNSCGYNDHSIPPVRPAENHAYHITAAFAWISIFVALNERYDSGRGQIIDLAVHDSVALSLEMANIWWFYPRAIVQRQTCAAASPLMQQAQLFSTRDGRFVLTTLVIADIKTWKSLVGWMDTLGIAVDLTDPAYEDLIHRQDNFGHIQDILETLFLIQDADDIYREGQSRGLPMAVLNTPDDVLNDEHLLARGFFQPVDHAELGSVLYPGPPARFSAHPSARQVAAPALGSHRLEDVLT